MIFKNIAIIAHVDHGKTTLVDSMLKQTGSFSVNQAPVERVMDSNDLEKERGITIMAKCTSVMWKDTRINIIDTPGHSDFGGEVERILGMVDSVILLVDASEGPMPQTKFVLKKALELNLKPIVVINKVDRQDERADEVHSEVFDLFANLGANDEQLDFPTLFAVGRSGWAVRDLKDERKDLSPLFDLILSRVPNATTIEDKEPALLISMIENDDFLGRIVTGKLYCGSLKTNLPLKSINQAGELVEQGRVTKIIAFRGISKVPLEEAFAGDIISIAGFSKATVSDVLVGLESSRIIKATPIDPPTLTMTFSVNDSPFTKQDGTKVTSSAIGERLHKEAEGNVAIKVSKNPNNEAFEVSCRGELQLGVLIETMRREGFEFSISRPKVLFIEKDGKKMEPIEEAIIDVDDAYSGVVMEKMSKRKAEIIEMRPSGVGKTRLVFKTPSRTLIGYQPEFLTDTKGTGIMNRIFHAYEPYKGDIDQQRNGVLVSTEQGEVTAYALDNIEKRGRLFLSPGEQVYTGMIIGEHSRENDLYVNPVKGKQLTNVRAAGKDDAVQLAAPVKHTLETAISYIQDDEMLEVTPKKFRFRKKNLKAKA